MSRTIRRVAILGHTERPGVRRAAARLRSRLERNGMQVRVESALAEHIGAPPVPLTGLARWCQVMISLGGDGTVLTAGRAMAGKRGALLPINLGGLGFLAAAEAPELDTAVNEVLNGRWKISARTGVSAKVIRRGGGISRHFALNDVVVRSETSYAALHMRLLALGHDLGRLVADGLIAASSSGSTAYSLSAGGPVISPELSAMVVTPACPHALGSRSLVLGPGSTVGVLVLGPGAALLISDGQDPRPIAPGDTVESSLSRSRVRFYENPERPFLRALHAKLGWQGSTRRSF